MSPLPPHGEWRRALALDRSGAEPHAVVLTIVPAAVLDEPARLAAVVRDVEAAGRLHHPAAIPVLGTETVDDALALVEAYRPGVTLRALLDAGGRLPADVAARIVVDACAAIARAHALDAGDGRRLVHGAIAPSRIVVADDGAALVAGFGTGAGADPAGDVRALAAVLHECLDGEPPGNPPARLEGPGIPAALAAAVDRALGAAPGGPGSASALAEAVASVGPIASHADVAAYVDAIVAPDEGARGELARALASALRGGLPRAAPLREGDAEEVSEDYIVEPTDPVVRARAEPTPEPLPRPPATRPGVDPVGVFAAPGPPVAPSRAPAVVAVLCAGIGFAVGFAATRFDALAGAIADLARTPPRAVDAAASPLPPARPPPVPGAKPASAETKGAISARPPARAAPAKPAGGTRAKPARGAPAAASAPGPAREAQAAGKGMLHVTAPDEAEVFLDGRRVGKGNVRLDVVEGIHRIEVRLGEARVEQGFSLEPGETWTYDVTPTSTP